jgi:hypothetical protein
MLILLLDAIGVIAVLWILFTQMIYPALKGIPIFPALSPKLEEATVHVQTERENLMVAKLEKEAEELRKQVADLTKSQS